MTPGIEDGGKRLDAVRDAWRKQIESEERLKFWRKMVGWGLSVREVQHLGEEIHNKYRSENMKLGMSEKVVVKMITDLKLKDEKKHQRELKCIRNEKKELLAKGTSNSNFKKLISKVNNEAKKWRRVEKSKYNTKANHLFNLRQMEEENKLQTCPAEISTYKNIKVFNKIEMEAMKKEKVEIESIGDVELDPDEKALLSLPPKFAVRRKLSKLDQKTDLELCMAKVRMQTHKENRIREIEGNNNIEKKSKKPKVLNEDETKDLEELDKLEAEARQIYDPLSKTFDHGNKRCTDMPENKRVFLPNHVTISQRVLSNLLRIES